jgi:hypothetical protein
MEREGFMSVANKILFIQRVQMLLKLMMPHQGALKGNEHPDTLARWIPELQESIEHCFEEDVANWTLMTDDEFTAMFQRLQKEWPRYVEYQREIAAEHYAEFGD